MKLRMLAVIVFTLSGSALGQTAKDIETRFGKPTNAYSVSEHIWMTPEYDADGQVCQMRFYPKRIGPNKDMSPTFDDFLPSQGSSNEIVTVKWNTRRCAAIKDSH